ncbi:MBL fold metallo-hydrolase [bacterium]|nr:MBL fold metallo-hydrolase [bacterium]
MGVRITVLGSGSAGNCTLLETDDCRLLLDAGLSARQVRQRLGAVGGALAGIDAILLTHEHADHCGALAVLSRERPIPVYANRLTAEAVLDDAKYSGSGRGRARISWRLFETGARFNIGDLAIESFGVPHDAVDPVNFVVRQPATGLAIGFLTDLGHPTKLAIERVRDVDFLLLEANHDVRMLQDDTIRPWPTKQRIMSRHGHLCNDDAAQVAGAVAGSRLRQIVLAHLSRDCNRPDLAQRVVGEQLQQRGAGHVQLAVACQELPLATLQVG